MANFRKRNANKGKKPSTDTVVKPEVKTGTSVFTGCMIFVPVNLKELFKKNKK